MQVEHAPTLHTANAGHTVPHAPQLEAVVRRSTSQPSAAIALQSPKPVEHATPQALAAQAGVLLARAGHALPHAPQWLTLVASVTSQPLAAAPSQSSKPGAHANAHMPDAHVGAALARAGHATPQRPQFEAFASRSTSQPSAAMPLQSAKPSVQAKPHAPAAQVARAFAGAVQATPQPPQWATLVTVLVSQPSAAMPLQSPKPAVQA
jgi:hypothetical protein